MMTTGKMQALLAHIESLEACHRIYRSAARGCEKATARVAGQLEAAYLDLERLELALQADDNLNGGRG